MIVMHEKVDSIDLCILIINNINSRSLQTVSRNVKNMPLKHIIRLFCVNERSHSELPRNTPICLWIMLQNATLF